MMNKKRIILVLIIFVLIIACSCPGFPILTITPRPSSTREPGSTEQQDSGEPLVIAHDNPVFDYSWDDRSPFIANLSTEAQYILSELPGSTIYHIAFYLDDPPNRVLGLEEILYTNTETVPLNEINLALFPELLGGDLEITRVTIDGTQVSPTYEGWLIRLPLEETLEPEAQVTLSFEFVVEVPTGGGDLYYGIFGYNDGTLSFAHAYPTILVYNQEGWNNQTPDLDGDPLFSDTSFYLVSINAPIEYELVTSGVEISRSETSDKQTILVVDGPARDFYLAASKGWVKQSRSIGKTELNSYSLPATLSSSQDSLDYAASAIIIFIARYGSYPYTEFDIVPIITSAGGVEYPGLTSISEDSYSWGEFLEIIIVHELAHMWFYNLVGNDNLDQPWLDESLAQFATWQYYLDNYGAEQADIFASLDLRASWDMAADPSAPIGLPVAAYQGNDYVPIVYGRGPFFIMELRDYMGIEKFDQFMYNYVQLYAWDIATTEGFKLLAEQTCDCNLSPLFEEWVYP